MLVNTVKINFFVKSVDKQILLCYNKAYNTKHFVKSVYQHIYGGIMKKTITVEEIKRVDNIISFLDSMPKEIEEQIYYISLKMLDKKKKQSKDNNFISL